MSYTVPDSLSFLHVVDKGKEPCSIEKKRANVENRVNPKCNKTQKALKELNYIRPTETIIQAVHLNVLFNN